MRKILFIGLIGFILLMGLILAADFTPQGDINLRSTYDLWNAIQINSTSNITAGGYFVGDGSYITGIAGYTTWAQVVNGTVYLSSNPFGFYNSTNPSPVTNTSYYLVTNPFSYYNSTDFSIGDYYLKNNPYSYYNSTNPSPVINTSYYLVANPFSFYNETNFNVSDYYLLNNPFSYYNETDFNMSDYRTLSNYTFYGDIVVSGTVDGIDIFGMSGFVTSNSLHRAGNGSDHSNVAFNTANITTYNNTWTTTDSEIWTVVDNETFYRKINPFSFYNSTDFSIADYATETKVDSLGNWSADKGDYSTTATIDGWGFYNSTDFSISDYFTSAETITYINANDTSANTTLKNWIDAQSFTADGITWANAINGTLYLSTNPFGFYNETDFNISDYYTKSNINGFNYYNSTDFSISDYATLSAILGWNYYNETNFNISDYYSSSDIDGFSYYNATDFDYADYRTLTNNSLEGNLDLNDNDILDVDDIGSTSDEIDDVFIGTNQKIYFGDGQEFSMYYNGTYFISG